VAPGEGGTRAYQLLLDAMRKTGYAGVAKVTMHGRENIVIIRARDNGLTLHTMFYNNEIRAVSESAVPKKLDVKEQESKLAVQLIESLAAPFEPAQYSDSYQVEVQKLIDAKAHGKKLTVVPRVQHAPVVDLMEALKKSLSSEKASQRKPALRAVSKPAETEKKSRKVG
jgi:DNA end-binding protein Ku